MFFKPTHESAQTKFVIGNINNVHFVAQETQKVLVLRAKIEYGNAFLKYSNMFKLAYNEDGPELLNRVIKIALDKEGKETEAPRALMQAFDEEVKRPYGAFSLN